MKVDIQELLDKAGLQDENFYPGKKLVKKYVQPGEYKSHCMVFDWRDRDHLRVELKAGLLGTTLDAKELRNYPVSFQAPTYLDITTGNDNERTLIEDSEEDEDGSSARGKSGGGGKKPAQKRNIDTDISSLSAFSKIADGVVSLAGEIEKFVVMGREIAKEGYAQALDNLKQQLSQAKVMAMDLMKGVSDILQKATPGGGLEARGDEKIKYNYDVEKTSPMFGGMSP